MRKVKRCNICVLRQVHLQVRSLHAEDPADQGGETEQPTKGTKHSRARAALSVNMHVTKQGVGFYGL